MSIVDFIRKSINWLFRHLHFGLFKKIRSLYFFKSTGIILGNNIRLDGIAPNIKVGSNINIYDNAKIELNSKSELRLGTNIILSYGVILCCRNKVTIGDNVQIGEYTSIRDATHNYKGENSIIMKNDDLVGEIIIGNNV